MISLFKKKKVFEESRSFQGNSFLQSIKPRERYKFHSDYFEIDDGIATIVRLFHHATAPDGFPPFWGINKIPSFSGWISNQVKVVLLEQNRVLPEGLVKDFLKGAEKLSRFENANSEEASTSAKKEVNKRQSDMDETIDELGMGASYIQSFTTVMIKAPNLDVLDEAMLQLSSQYKELFSTIKAAPYEGRQRTELSDLFKPCELKRGSGDYFTSVEYAGSYNLVTCGLVDDCGEYVGTMMGDVNNSAVLFDADMYSKQVVIAGDQRHNGLNAYLSDLWGFKLGLSALCREHKVVHIVLNQTDLQSLGVSLEKSTVRVDLQSGEVNLFEMFGDKKDASAIFSRQIEKIKLMVQEAQGIHEKTSARLIVESQLARILENFYVDQRMWHKDANNNLDKLRIVGLDHKVVPTLKLFVAYLMKEEKATKNENDIQRLEAIRVLLGLFNEMLTAYGDLFNNTTSPVIDSTVGAQRVIYDLSNIFLRSSGIATAQLVNIFGYATQSLKKGDVVILHGVDRITSEGVKKYLLEQARLLKDRGGRIVYVYDNIGTMLSDKAFCEFDKADYTVFGTMTESELLEYQKRLGQAVPADLAHMITLKVPGLCYIRRGIENVVFKQDLILSGSIRTEKKALRRKES